MITIKIAQQAVEGRLSGRLPDDQLPDPRQPQLPILEGLKAIFYVMNHPGLYLATRPHYEYCLRYLIRPSGTMSPAVAVTVGSPDQRIAGIIRGFLDLNQAADRAERFARCFNGEVLEAALGQPLRASLLVITRHADLPDAQLLLMLKTMERNQFLELLAMAIEYEESVAPLLDGLIAPGAE